MKLIKLTVVAVAACASALSFPALLFAADVLVIGDTQLRPVVEIVSGIRKTFEGSLKVVNPSELNERLEKVVAGEKAKAVIALGKDALALAVELPSSIPVIYDLVVTPPPINRPNTTGFYMATPAREYAALLRNYFRSIKKVTVMGGREQLKVLGKGAPAYLAHHSVKNSLDFIEALNNIGRPDAILLLPDVSMLTSRAMNEAYLYSFRNGIPLLGVSERHVKLGALLALVVDPANVGREIGEYATRAIRGENIGGIPPSPPHKYEMYVNADTAKKMGIFLPEDLVKKAKRVY